MNDAAVRSNVSAGSIVAEAADEYVECLRRGERPSVEDFQARYPQAASVIPQVFAALQLMQSLGAKPELSAGSEPVQNSVPETLGDYRILRELGRGGMGIVYQAEQVSLGCQVALKILPFAATLDPKRLTRFQNEARAAAALDHPNIVSVYSVGCEHGIHFYTMQYVEGRSLAEIVGQRRSKSTVKDDSTMSLPNDDGCLAERDVRELGIQAADALAYSHKAGILHRDIKPANLLVDSSGKLWITDFGLARLESEPGMTMTGDLLGTLRYMSPEQALAKSSVVDQRTDIYSLGATLYELLTLEPVFAGGDRQELLRQIAFEKLRRPRSLNPAISPMMETVLLRALEKCPERRYSSAADFADDLRRLDSRQSITPLQWPLSSVSRRRVAFGVVVLGLAILLAAVVPMFFPSPASPKRGDRIVRARAASVIPLNDHGRIELHRFTATAGKFDRLNNWFRNDASAVLKQHGMHLVAAGQSEDAKEHRTLYCWIKFPRGKNREEVWQEFKADPVCALLFSPVDEHLVQSTDVDSLFPVAAGGGATD